MDVSEDYDAIVIGAGPAGIFAALELSRSGVDRVLLLEKGREIADRRCPARETHCVGCRRCDIMTGWGGAGAFSDGKLTLSTQVGGWLGEFVGDGALGVLLEEADEVWLAHGADPRVYEADPEAAGALVERASSLGMRLVPMRIRHIGTDRAPAVLAAMRTTLEERGVVVRTGVSASRVVSEGARVSGVELEDGTLLSARALIVAPGREGSDWLAGQARALGVDLSSNAVDIGVRVELPATVLEPLTDHLYEAKLLYRSQRFGDEVRTFCMNPRGEVTTESYGELVTVNGHSFADSSTDNTNFAVLVSQRFTEPFDEPITYGASVARLANLLGDGILVQRLGDLRAGRRSTAERIASSSVVPSLPGAAPGDLSFALPYRHLTGILEFIERMDEMVPGVASPDTLLYGIEVKFYSSRLELDGGLMTTIHGLFAAGDGAGVTRGLAQSSASGLVAARAAIDRCALS